MVTAVNRHRVESPERWAKALQRAIEHGIDVLDIAGDPAHFAVESQSRPGVVHLVDAAGRVCTCEAAVTGDPVCAHRAIVRFAAGLLAMPVALAVATKDAASTGESIECGECHDRGWHYIEAMGGRAFPDQVACRRCAGTGQMPVQIRMLASAPALAAD